ncbi:LPXTG cell wall anchor domain-containing protein [Enterococcus ratti]
MSNQPIQKQELSKTGSTQSIQWGVIGFLLMVFVGFVWLKHSKSNK